MQQITVFIADDHALFREGLRLLLTQDRNIVIVGEAADGQQAMSLTESLQPDILLLDVRMPDVDGLEILPWIRAKCPLTKVLILSGFSEEEFVSTALELGAKGYLLKTLTHKDLLRAIHATYAGEIWAERRVLTQILETLRKKVSDLHGPLAETRETLTDREQEVVTWVMQGKTNKEVAAHLGISEKTVKTHVRNIFSKLRVSRRIQLPLYRIADRAELSTVPLRPRPTLTLPPKPTGLESSGEDLGRVFLKNTPNARLSRAVSRGYAHLAYGADA
jgi:DNA-binding NarL/FixJ family response regulator